MFSHSKILPAGLSQPRCKLSAASLNAHTGEDVKRALKAYHKQAFKLMDSQIVLHWLNNKDLTLKLWVRARVIEILRLNDACDWWYVKGSEMIGDLGTRRGATVTGVNQKSSWNLCLPWMNQPSSEFPIKTYTEVRLDINQSNDSSRIVDKPRFTLVVSYQ